MGLMDVLKGMQNGPHGQRGPSAGSGGMSPITMAVLGLLAYKALKSFTSQPMPCRPARPLRHQGLGANPGGACGRACRRSLAIFSRAAWAACSPAAPRAAC